jgi:hypothetical protein
LLDGRPGIKQGRALRLCFAPLICFAAESFKLVTTMADPRRLTDLRGVGTSIAADLHQLGIFTVEQLASSDGRDLYDRLCALTGVRQDPCVEDTFVCAVAQAKDSELPAEQRNWWFWSRLRKRGGAQPDAKPV